MNRKIFSEINLPMIIRNVFAGFLFITIVQKLIDKKQFENLSLTISQFFYGFNYFGKLETIVFYSIIIIEIFIIISLYFSFLYKWSLRIALFLLLLGSITSILSIYYGFNNTCGCGLFGDNPYLILWQKIVLIIMLLYLWKNSNFFS
jgi:hypothetical protein